jgi:hypothetical protein
VVTYQTALPYLPERLPIRTFRNMAEVNKTGEAFGGSGFESHEGQQVVGMSMIPQGDRFGRFAP